MDSIISVWRVVFSWLMNRKIFAAFFLLCSLFLIEGNCQENNTRYKNAFDEIKRMLEGKQRYSFKRAVFVTENAFMGGRLNYDNFCKEIEAIAVSLKQFVARKNIQHYKTAYHYAAFSYITDSIPENNFQPYTYDFDDFLGRENYESMFVTKLLRTKRGNCHSLPYFYKIICDEAGAESFLAIAPNHCYIKHKDETGIWVNIELTSSSTPRDQWIIQQMSVSVEAIRSGAYMKPLSNQEALASCLFTLANCYQRQFGYDEFFLSIVDEGLKYYPNSIELNSRKANYHYFQMQKAQKENQPDAAKYHLEQNKKATARINELGFQEESPEKYQEWVKTVEEEKVKSTKP